VAVLHITRPGAKVRLRKGRFVVEKDGVVIATAPKHQVDRIVLHGNVGLSTPALVYCMRRGVPVFFVSSRGRIYGKAVAANYTSAEKLKAQILLQENEERRVALARVILQGKISSQKSYARLRRARSPCNRLPAPPLFDDLLQQLERAQTLAQLRGIEGTAAASYFEILSCGWEKYGFLARNKRPPRDPVNAALSYGYAVLQGVVESAVLAAGLHPEIGLLHSTTRRNAALVFDLMEEFRVVVVDRTVGRLFGRGQLQPQRDFSHSEYRVLLNRQGKVALLEGLEEQLQSRRRNPLSGRKDTLMVHIYKQAASLEAAIVRGQPYAPFYMEGQ